MVLCALILFTEFTITLPIQFLVKCSTIPVLFLLPAFPIMFLMLFPTYTDSCKKSHTNHFNHVLSLHPLDMATAANKVSQLVASNFCTSSFHSFFCTSLSILPLWPASPQTAYCIVLNENFFEENIYLE